MNNCLFCDFSKNKNYVCDAGNFYILVGKGIITDGHCMIVSKKHYSCFGEMDTKLLLEYKELKDRLIKFIEKNTQSRLFWNMVCLASLFFMIIVILFHLVLIVITMLILLMIWYFRL